MMLNSLELTRNMELIITNQPDNGATEDTEIEPEQTRKISLDIYTAR